MRLSVNHEHPLLASQVLGREWNGKMQWVAVLADGFAGNGEIFSSLCGVALAITGTRWNGRMRPVTTALRG